MARPAQGYKNTAGQRVPGTTTIIGRFKDSGALLHWAFKQGQSGAASLYEKRDEAAEAGTLAHDMIEAFILSHPAPEIVGVNPQIAERAANAFAQFREWWDQTRIEIIATERGYVSERHQFGGTVDAIGRDTKGRIVLVDWKTSNGVYCHPPGTLVLTHDWRWVPVESLAVGSKIRSFTENRIGKRGREWSDAIVLNNGVSRAPEGIRTVLESGQEMISTPDHPYLARRAAGGRRMTEGGVIWLRADQLRIGNKLPRYFTPWTTDRSYKAGWFAGLLDGEGCLTSAVGRKYGCRLSFAQKPGAVLDLAKQYLRESGIEFREHDNHGVTQVTINGGIAVLASILGSTRPVRLLPKLNPVGQMMTPSGGRDSIIRIERTGPMDVVNLTTSSGTYFANGYGSHNTDYLTQLGAYALLLEECAPEWKPEAFHLLRVAKESADFAHHYYGELEDAKAQFILFRQAYEIDGRLKKRAA